MKMKAKETDELFVKRILAESIVDIDLAFCARNSVTLNNHEIDAKKVDLFNSKANKAAFNLVFKKK